MSQQEKLRVLFCAGVNQNFMDATQEVMGEVWKATGEMLKGVDGLPGLDLIGIMDDDRIQVGPSTGAPWTFYIMADVPDYDTAVKVCDFFRSTPVGDGTYKLWKFMKVEARIGRKLVVPE